MQQVAPNDSDLISDLTEMAVADKWDFRSWSAREFSHGFFQYPAMMVPQMQRELLQRLQESDREATLYDPFVGSGTTMSEAMGLGMDFVGTDINPLAVLLCRAKAGPFFVDAIGLAIQRVLDQVAQDRVRRVELEWDGWAKWFRNDVAIGLSRIRRAIRQEPTLSTRRFLWVCLAETVRLTSNSRTSTVKLHVRPSDEISTRQIDTLKTFRRIAERNHTRFTEHRDALNEEERLRHGHYVGQVEVFLHDVSDGAGPIENETCGILLTSPPYGDNATTVPYGQHAYLPLQWIDLKDIDVNADETFLASTHAIDSMCLGAPTKGALDAVTAIRAVSPMLDETLTSLVSEPPDRARRVAAFWRDFDTSLDNIVSGLAPGSAMAWTVGNRRVGGRHVPMDQILCELLQHRGAVHMVSLSREIPDCRKRQPSRNSVSETIDSERVLVFRTSAQRDDD